MFRSQNFGQTTSSANFYPNHVVAITADGYLNFINATSFALTASNSVTSTGYTLEYGNSTIAAPSYGTSIFYAYNDNNTSTELANFSLSPSANPFGVVYNSNNNVFAVASGNGYIDIINANTLSLVTSINTSGLSLYGIQYTNNKYYVANFSSSGTVEVYNANTYAYITSISVGSFACAMGFGNGKIICTNYISGSVSIIDPTTDTVTSTITTGGNPYGFKVGHGNGYFAVADNTNGTVAIINSTTETLTTTLTIGGGLWETTYLNGNFYVSSFSANEVYIIDATTHTLTNTVTLTNAVTGLAAMP